MQEGGASARSTAVDERIYRAMLDAAPDAMIGVDREGRIVMANAQTEKLFGYERRDLIGRAVEALVPERVRAVHPKHRADYFREPRVRPMGTGLDLAGRRADGTEFPAEISLSWIETEDGPIALGAIRDISARKKAEANFQAMLDAAPDAMLGVDGAGVILMANAQTEAVFGYRQNELIGRPLEDLLPDRAKEIHPSHRDEYFREPRVRPMGTGLDLAGRRADGTEFPAEISLSSIETEKGTIALGAIRDITDRKRAEDEIRRARDEAALAFTDLQASNDELQAFSYAVAHDLRAPLRAIDGFSKAILQDYEQALGEDGRSYLDRVRSNVKRMASMIDALLELSRLVRSTLDASAVDLSSLVEEIAQTLKDADPRREVTFTIQPSLVARGDRGLLFLLLTNLVSNAWKFTAPHDRGRIEFGVDVTDGRRAFYVRDDGVGFDPRYADTLFTPFQRLHAGDELGGSGIGLATAERIVRRHGGSIWARGSEEHGATFWFTLGEDR